MSAPAPHERSRKQSAHVRSWWRVWYAPPDPSGVWCVRDGLPAVLLREVLCCEESAA
jgi:hypothetical protein